MILLFSRLEDRPLPPIGNASLRELRISPQER
jgi:hypothetical protein